MNLSAGIVHCFDWRGKRKILPERKIAFLLKNRRWLLAVFLQVPALSLRRFAGQPIDVFGLVQCLFLLR